MPQLYPLTRAKFVDDVVPILNDSLPNLTIETSTLADVWFEVFKDTNAETAKLAIKTFATTRTKYPSPAAMREVVVEIHAERLPADLMPRHAPDRGDFASDADFEAAYMPWLQAWRTQVRLGATVEQADEAALEAVGQRLNLAIERPHVLELESLQLKRSPISGPPRP